MTDIKLNDIVELTPEWREYFKEMRKKNPKLKEFCSFLRGVVINIRENKITDTLNIVTVLHDNGKTYDYYQHHLQLCHISDNNCSNIVIEYNEDEFDLEKKGNTKIMTIPTRNLTIKVNDKEHHISFDNNGNMIILK